MMNSGAWKERGINVWRGRLWPEAVIHTIEIHVCQITAFKRITDTHSNPMAVTGCQKQTFESLEESSKKGELEQTRLDRLS
jgi:hypothetical protein